MTNVIYSDDQGQSWKGTEWVPGYGNESQLVELSDGALMSIFGPRRAGTVRHITAARLLSARTAE